MLFVDQPVNVGFSYSEGDQVDNTPDAAEDVYAFLQLFFGRFKEYSRLPFHIATESYGGRYAPLMASSIHKHNKALSSASNSDDSLAPKPRALHINLASVLIGNGRTEPQTQMGAVPTFACEGPYPVHDPNGPECRALKRKTPICQRLVGNCYEFGNQSSCASAADYCESEVLSPPDFQKLGLNPYDVRRKCDDDDGGLCYAEVGWIETFLNNATLKRELGVLDEGRKDIEFRGCNVDMDDDFANQGDGMHNSAAVIPEMLEDGIRFLIYAGNADYRCNFIGNEQWMVKLDSKFQAEFQDAPLVTYRTLSGRVGGRVRSAGAGGIHHLSAGNFTYVVVTEAGHMVP
ncbi:alpha/beta-hydrolase, partial [Clavulina sp. PMI_390]